MIIYVAVCEENGKCYVGQTVRTLCKRRVQHVSNAMAGRGKNAFPNALRKHGPHSFTWWEIDKAESKDGLNALEKYYIQELDALAPNGYNLDGGGTDRSTVHADTRAKQRESHLGKRPTEETLRRMSESRKGKPMTKQCHDASSEVRSIPIIMENRITKEIRSFKSGLAMAQEFDLNPSLICAVIKGRRKQTGGRCMYRADGEAKFKRNPNKTK